MSPNIFDHLARLAVSLLVTMIVWRFYRRRTVPPAERYTTFWPRFWTGSVDSCILWPVGFIAALLLSPVIPGILVPLLIVAPTLVWFLYTVAMHARYGQTVGKMATKVRVVDVRTEGSISWRQAWLREGIPMALSLGILAWEVYVLLARKGSGRPAAGDQSTYTGYWIVRSLPFLWLLAEVLTMLTNEKRRALHDFIAGTVVVRTNATEEYFRSGVLRSGDTAAL